MADSPLHPHTGDPRRWRIRTRKGAAPVLVLPTVNTISAIATSNSTATVVGVINPNGLDTVWWLVYGTSLPLSGRVGGDPAAAAQALYPSDSLWPSDLLWPSLPISGPPDLTIAGTPIGSGTNNVQVSATLTGLFPNAQSNYVAVVARSAAGTVYGNTILIVPEALPSTPNTPGGVAFGASLVTIPHFNVPFSLTTGGAAVTEQDTLEEVVANVNVVVDCTVGECPQLPTFGRPELTFAQEPVDTTDLVFAIQQLEPRATEDVLSQLASDGVNWNIALSTSTTSAQGV